MKIRILAAGRGKRLKEMTENIPKPLISVNGIPIIERLINQLSNYKNKYEKIEIVTGYKNHKFEYLLKKYSELNITLIYNEEWETKNNAFSYIKDIDLDEYISIEGDGVFDQKIIDIVFKEIDNYENVLFGDYIYGYEGSRFTTNEENKIIKMQIVREIEKNKMENTYKSIGIMKFGKEFNEELIKNIKNAKKEKNDWYLDNFIAELIEKHKINVVNIYPNHWIEIDTKEDYCKAKNIKEDNK